MRSINPPPPHRHREVIDCFDPQLLESVNGTHDVEHCVDRSDLVQMHLLGRHAVHFAFCFTE